MAAHSVESRSVESTVVVDPAGNHGAIHSRKVFNRFVTLQLQPPPPELLTQRFGCARCDGRGEVVKEASIAILAAPRAKGVAQKFELDLFVLVVSMNILAVDDPCLIGMKFQTTFLQPLRESLFHILRLLETAAVDQSVISVPAEG